MVGIKGQNALTPTPHRRGGESIGTVAFRRFDDQCLGAKISHESRSFRFCHTNKGRQPDRASNRQLGHLSVDHINLEYEIDAQDEDHHARYLL